MLQAFDGTSSFWGSQNYKRLFGAGVVRKAGTKAGEGALEIDLQAMVGIGSNAYQAVFL